LPDLNRAIKGRKKKLQKIWSTQEWKDKKAAFMKLYPWCEMHLSVGIHEPATVPHHPYRNGTGGHYTDLELSQCVAYCKRCHFSIHHGRKLCPVCKDAYPMWDAEMCWSCFCKQNPDIVEKIAEKKRKNKAIQKQLRNDQKKRVTAIKAKIKRSSK
jgi:hypothetical protein